MRTNTDRVVSFTTEAEFSSLYRWSLIETDPATKKASRPQVPWNWTLPFRAEEIALHNSTAFRKKPPVSDHPLVSQSKGMPHEDEVVERRVMRANLRSGYFRDGSRTNVTLFQMFGTDRAIEEIELEVHRLETEQEAEICEASGLLSYTAEGADFDEVTHSDFLSFYLLLRPSRFDRYEQLIFGGDAKAVSFSVGGVAGFYSEWSPGIVTSKIKVLPRDALASVENIDGHKELVQGLGYVAKADLSVHLGRSFSLPEY